MILLINIINSYISYYILYCKLLQSLLLREKQCNTEKKNTLEIILQHFMLKL